VTPTFDEVRDVLVTTLGIEDRATSLSSQTPLLDHLTELDSMAVVEVLTALEDRFGIHIDDSEVSGELFETLGSLTEFVQAKAGQG
jgi:acyl carrier protein